MPMDIPKRPPRAGEGVARGRPRPRGNRRTTCPRRPPRESPSGGNRMPVYQWVGKNRLNKVQKGEMEAQSEEAVRASLARQKITPTRIKTKPKDLFENVKFLKP